jgi:hypothetical protein
VKAFEPYDSIKEENPEARAAGRALIAEGQAAGPKHRTFIYVNNRLEGNAISTIAAMIQPTHEARPRRGFLFCCLPAAAFAFALSL